MSPRLAQAVRDLVEVSARAGHLGPMDAAQTEALRSKVLDRFAKGDYHGGLDAILGRTRNTRARGAVIDVTESALLSLGVDVTRAKAAWKTALTSLGRGQTLHLEETPSPRASPIRNVFRGLGFPLDDQARVAIRLHALQQARIESSLEKALADPQRITALRALEEKLDFANLPDLILSGLLNAHREDESWTDLARVYEAAPKEFQKLPAAKREYALALNQLGRTKESRAVLEDLTRSGDRSNVTLGLQGRILKDRHDKAKAEGDPRADAFLEGAIKAYREGFFADMNALYPAVALPVVLEEKGSPKARQEARAVATVLLYNAERRSRFGESQYWDAATALEMACVLGDDARIERWLSSALGSASEPWMRVSTAKNIERLVRVRGAAASPVLSQAAAALRAVPAEVRPLRGARALSSARPHATDERERVLASLLEKSYRFGGRSPKWLSGNYAYAGIAHDVRVTPSDVTYFDRVLRAAGIDQITDPLKASQAMDTLIRGHFGTDQLENLQSPEHQFYDRVMPGLARLTAASRENSQTNVSADWINGLADCRQHAPSKLMLWEAWKRAQTNQLLDGIYRFTKAGNPGQAAELEKKLDALTPWELRILDAQVIDRRDGKMREEHTLTILVKRGSSSPDGKLSLADDVRLADSFYHRLYPFADGKLDAVLGEGGALTLEVPGKSADGAPIALVPAAYSFDRANESRDYGQLSFRGRTVATPGWELDVPVEGLDLSKLHAYVDAEMRAVLDQAKNATTPARAG